MAGRSTRLAFLGALALVGGPAQAAGPPLPWPAEGVGLSAAAAATNRPPECRAAGLRGLAAGPTVWQLARVPNLQPYCDLLAKAHAELLTDPEAAAKKAKEAASKLQGHAAPEVVLGRASLLLGSPKDAVAHFDRAGNRDPRSLEDPATMHDVGRALLQTGQLDRALAVYRALVPRTALLPNDRVRVVALLEAAHVVMTVAQKRPANAPATPSEGAPVETQQMLLEEALAFLREARRRPMTVHAGDVLLSLALVLDRMDGGTEADSVLAEAKRTGARLSRSDPRFIVDAADASALRALGAEVAGNRTEADREWSAYLAAPGAQNGAWAAAARARQARLRQKK